MIGMPEGADWSCYAQDQGVLRRVQIQAHNVQQFGFKLGVRTEGECPDAMGPQLSGNQLRSIPRRPPPKQCGCAGSVEDERMNCFSVFRVSESSCTGTATRGRSDRMRTPVLQEDCCLQAALRRSVSRDKIWLPPCLGLPRTCCPKTSIFKPMQRQIPGYSEPCGT